MTFLTRRPIDTGDANQDFAVKLDAPQPMIYATRTKDPTWHKHEHYGVWSLSLGLDGIVYSGCLDTSELLRSPDYEQHGWFMWSAWFIVGLLLLVTKRYAKKYWRVMHYLHAGLGYFVLVVTIVFALRVT